MEKTLLTNIFNSYRNYENLVDIWKKGKNQQILNNIDSIDEPSDYSW